jgi:hypothetical protein
VVDGVGDLLIDIVLVVSLSARLFSPAFGVGESDDTLGHVRRIGNSACIDVYAESVDGVNGYPRRGEFISGFAIEIEVWIVLAAEREVAGEPEQILSAGDAREIMRQRLKGIQCGHKVTVLIEDPGPVLQKMLQCVCALAKLIVPGVFRRLLHRIDRLH